MPSQIVELFLEPSTWAAFASLLALELVLGIDNVVFIAVIAGRLPESQRARARNFGIGLALVLRILFLASIAWIIGLKQAAFTVYGFVVSWKDLILLAGGLFLLIKASHEIHSEIERGHAPKAVRGATSAGFLAAVSQIVLIDAVFSLDSVIVAVGLGKHLYIMVTAVVVAVAVMAVMAGPVSRFISRNPTTRMLALAFLLVVGIALVAEGLHLEHDRRLIYAAMGFAAFVEGLHMLRRRGRPGN